LNNNVRNGKEREQGGKARTILDDKPFDVFLSHSSPDKPAVEELARRLEDEERLKPWLDKWNLVPGEPWQEALEKALDSSRTCAVFIGRGDIRPWENEEMRSALQTHASQPDFRVIPILLPGATLPERGELPRFLSRLTWVDFRGADGLDDADAFRRLVAGIRGIAPGRVEATPTAHLIECPYRGLEVFDEAHARFFFGREGMTQHLVEALRPTRFLAVLGASGSGKSSLVRAGLLPKLKAGALPESTQWTYLVFKPGAHPLQELALSLTRVGRAKPLVEASLQLLRSLESDERSLHLYVRGSLAGQPRGMRFFILVDQFEESFTLCQNETERLQFINNLRYAVTVADGQTPILITMRADFLARAAEYTDLAELLSGHQFVVSPMNETDLREAIEEPARLAGISFEKGLAERILRDVGHEPGALPLLEHSLLQLCENRGGDNVMTLQAYDESGGVQGALAKRADDIFEGLRRGEQQAIARRIMLRLTQPGEGTEDTRRRAATSELCTRADEQAVVEQVIETLTVARLLTTSTAQSGERQVDVAHEALIRGWPRLRKWIDDDRSALRVHRRLTEAAQEWKEKNKDPSFLYRGVRLAQATEWRERNETALNPLEREFLDASARLQLKERRTAKLRVGLIVGGLVTALVLIGIFALRWYQEQRVAVSRELAANAISQLALNPGLSLLLALEAARVAHTDQAEDALKRSLRSQLIAVMRGHTATVMSAAFSPDGKFVVTASADSTARLWDAKTGQLVAELRGHTAKVMSAAFSPDGKFVVTASLDGTARVWDAKEGQTVAELRGHRGPVWTAAFGPDGKFVVTASIDQVARVWDAKTAQTVAELHGHTGPLSSASLSPDGKFVVTASADSTARLWDAKTGQLVAKLRGHTGPVHGAAFSPNGKFVVSVSSDATARIWDAKTGQLGTELRGHTGPVYGAAFSPDGKLVVTGSFDSTARVWNATTGQTVAKLLGHTDKVLTAAFSPDGKFVITASDDATARLWDPQTEQTVSEMRGHTMALNSAEFSRDGMFVATGSDDCTARVWDVRTAQPVTELRGHTRLVKSAAYSPNGKFVVTASYDSTARIWDATTGQSLAELRGHAEPVKSAAFSPDGKLVVTASDDSTARLWDTTGQLMAELRGHTGQVTSAEFSPDGRFVITASVDKTARVWNAKTGHPVAELRGHLGPVWNAAFDFESNVVVTSSSDSTARVWNATSGQIVAELHGHTDKVWSAVFSPDAKFVVTASEDNTARVWDVKTGKPVAELRGHTGSVGCAIFSSDGKLVVTCSDDNTARLWDAKTGQPMAELRGHTGGVNSVAFSLDDKSVVTASDDNTARVWDAKTGQTLAELRGHTRLVKAAEFSADGKLVVTASSDNTAQIYRCELCGSVEELLDLARRTRVIREFTAEERARYLHK
jgi:WD40 repeat protein